MPICLADITESAEAEKTFRNRIILRAFASCGDHVTICRDLKERMKSFVR